MLKVELKQQIVQRETRLGLAMVEVPQMQIFATMDDNPPVMVGYVGTQANAPINLIYPDLPVQIVDEIERQVRASRFEEISTSRIATPPTSLQMAELNESFEDVDESEDELEE